MGATGDTGASLNPPPGCPPGTVPNAEGVCVIPCTPGENEEMIPGYPDKCICKDGYDRNEEGICKPVKVSLPELSFSASVYFGGFFNTSSSDPSDKTFIREQGFPIIIDKVFVVVNIPGKEVKFYIDTTDPTYINNVYKGTFNKWITGPVSRRVGGKITKISPEPLEVIGSKTYVVFSIKGSPNYTMGKSGKHFWELQPDSIGHRPASKFLIESALLAKVGNGFTKDDSAFDITFKKVKHDYEDKVDKGVSSYKASTLPKSVIISEKSLNAIDLPVELNKSPTEKIGPGKVMEYIKQALNISGKPSSKQGGGAIIRINDHIDDVPYTFALQKLWEDKLKHYKSIEPEYQQMLPPPEPSPLEELQEPFHRYMDEFGDQDVLEEARMTIGLMSPEDAENLFHDDLPEINSMYEKAMPEIDDRLIPIFIRADILRLLTK
jgi:hypothetical protein